MNKALIQRLTNVDLTKCADLEAGDGVVADVERAREGGTSSAAAD